MDVYYHVEFQLCITSGSKVSRGVQNCTSPRNRMCSDTPWISVVWPSKLIFPFPLLFLCLKFDEIYTIFSFSAMKIGKFPFSTKKTLRQNYKVNKANKWTGITYLWRYFKGMNKSNWIRSNFKTYFVYINNWNHPQWSHPHIHKYMNLLCYYTLHYYDNHV